MNSKIPKYNLMKYLMIRLKFKAKMNQLIMIKSKYKVKNMIYQQKR